MREIVMTQMYDYLDSRDCLLQIHSMSDYIHQSWLLHNGEVICFENIPDNYPSGTLTLWASIDEYLEAVADVGWINDIDHVIHHNLGQYGFPFLEVEEDED